MDFSSLKVMVCFCHFFLSSQNSNNFIKDNKALQKEYCGKVWFFQFSCDWFLFCSRISIGKLEPQFLRMTMLSVHSSLPLGQLHLAISQKQRNQELWLFFTVPEKFLPLYERTYSLWFLLKLLRLRDIWVIFQRQHV